MKYIILIEMSVKTMLMKIFPSYRIKDASDAKDHKELLKILQISKTIPQLIVFILRNESNAIFFTIMEQQKGLTERIEIIYFYNNNHLYFSYLDNLEGQIRMFKNIVDNGGECIICYETIPTTCEDIIHCTTCGCILCNSCTQKLLITQKTYSLPCPVCRSVMQLI